MRSRIQRSPRQGDCSGLVLRREGESDEPSGIGWERLVARKRAALFRWYGRNSQDRMGYAF